MMVKWYSLISSITVKMWSSKCLIIVSLCFCTCYGQELLNSSELLNVDDYFGNYSNPNVNDTGDINRIVNGKPVNIGLVPYSAAILRRGRLHCGGSIVSNIWILTAAHCIERGERYQVRVGSRYYRRGGYIRNVRYAVVNSGYNMKNRTNDIALLKLTRPLKWSPKVKPIRLAKPKSTIPQKFLVSGWGATQEKLNNPSNVLRAVVISKVPRDTCKKNYTNQINITNLHICASSPGKDSCFGDSGGPLTNNRIQYGIVSGGIGCARPKYPGVYTNIQRQFRWIRNVIRRFGGAMPMFF